MNKKMIITLLAASAAASFGAPPVVAQVNKLVPGLVDTPNKDRVARLALGTAVGMVVMRFM